MREYFAILERVEQNDTQTLGVLSVFKDNQHLLTLKTLELSWQDNKKRVSCIPKGKYKVVPYSSKKYPKAFEIQDVPNRSNILIHQGNYYTDILGCVLVGKGLKDINHDGQRDLINSAIALTELTSIVNKDFDLFII